MGEVSPKTLTQNFGLKNLCFEKFDGIWPMRGKEIPFAILRVYQVYR